MVAATRGRAAAAHVAHNHEVGGSNPSPATIYHKASAAVERRKWEENA